MNNDGVWKMWKTMLNISIFEVWWTYFHLSYWLVDIKSLFINELHRFPQLWNVVEKRMWKNRVGERDVQNCCLSVGIKCIFSTHFVWFLDDVEKWWFIICFSISYPQVIHIFIKVFTKYGSRSACHLAIRPLSELLELLNSLKKIMPYFCFSVVFS